MTTLPGGFPQPFHVTQRRQAKELFVVPTKVCGIVVPHAVAGTCRVESLTEHQLSGFLESYLLLVLQGTHRGDGLKVVVKARCAHTKLLGHIFNAKGLVELVTKLFDRPGDALSYT